MAQEYRYLKSSNLQGARYDAESSTLYIQFTSGSEYSYDGVPESVYEDLCNAASPGSYFYSNIRGAYNDTQV